MIKLKKKTFLTIILLLISIFCLCGCSSTTNNTLCVVSIEKTESVGLVDIYTIIYSDGSSTQLEIANGKDGVNGFNGKDGESF